MNNLKPKVKLVGFSNKSNLACKAIVRSFLFFLILMFAATGYSQEIFSTITSSGYPSGTSLYKGNIILPVQYYRESRTFTIQFQSGYNPGNVALTTDGTPIYTCPELETTSTYSLNAATGEVTVVPGKYCSILILPEDTLEFKIKGVGDGGGNTKYQTFKIPFDRLPVKTALVMDISGSMGWPTSDGEIRWFVLKNSVDLFMTLYEFFRQDGDMVSLSYFTHYVVQPDPPIGAGFIPVSKYLATTPPPTSKDYILGDMNLKGPLYATAMGLGLLDAKTKLNSDVINRYRRVALLFTDGLQNVQPFVMDDGNNLTNGTTLNDVVSEINKIRYFIIASWVNGGAPPVLYHIASASNGDTKHTTSTLPSDTEVSDYFMAMLESILHGESPQIVGTAVGKVSNNEVSHTVNLNANISKAAFVFDYGTGDSINVVIEKNGTELPVSISTGTGFKIIGLQFPVTGTNETSSGQYKVKVAGNTAKTYKMTCLAEDHHFDYNVSLNKPYYSVGDTIEFTTEISLAGVPLNNPEDSVTIVLFKPGDDVGNLLALYNNADISQALVDEGTSAQQKYEVLFSTDSTFQNSLLPVEQKIVLNNNGNGVFKGEFKNTDVTGVYSMLVFLNARSETTGIIEREKIITTVFEFAQVVPEPPVVVDNTSITPTDTTAAVAPVPPDSTTTNTNAAPAIVDKFNPVVLQIRPKNKFGYFMGPGYVNKIWAKINPGKAQKPVINKSSLLGSNPPAAGEPYVSYIYGTLDGRYYIYVSDVKERTNPKIEIKVGSELYYSGKIFRIPCWFYLILIVLIILIIIIRYLKSKNKKIYELLLWIFTVICMLILILHYLGYLRFLY